jgi:hypothetical protein
MAAAQAAADRVPIETVVESFDILQCAVVCRLNKDLNGYDLGGPGATAIKQSIQRGMWPRMKLLTACVFGKVTDLPFDPLQTQNAELGELELRRALDCAVTRQMERIWKYLTRGFRFED